MQRATCNVQQVITNTIFIMEKEELILQTKNEILSLLKGVNRPGMDKVIWYLENSTYFTARCSSHHQFSGGLAVHSLGVYKEMKKLNPSIPEDSIRVVALLHDICKAHHPAYDHIGKWHHGARSVQLLDVLGLKFNTDEYYAIEKHMHRIHHIPSTKTYDSRDMLRHYIHQCDHRDAATYQGNFESYTPKRSLKYQIDTLLYNTHRPGIEIVIDHLHQNHEAFYNVPASVKYHNNKRGGLALHSMQVYNEAKEMYDKLIASSEPLSFDMNSITLCALLHDVCKMDEYKMENGQPEHTSHFHRGGPHGMKTEALLQSWHLALTDEERQAIIWHMGKHAEDAAAAYSTTYDAVASRSRLVQLIHQADSSAAKKHNS